jgi:hypothetical protein
MFLTGSSSPSLRRRDGEAPLRGGVAIGQCARGQQVASPQNRGKLIDADLLSSYG